MNDCIERNDWVDDFEYGYSRRDKNLNPVFNSAKQASAMFYFRQQ